MICLVADVNEQKAQPDRPAVGTVIEAKLDRGRGAVATILVQNGTLRTGDSYIVGNTFGKVRAMFDDRGRAITEAGPSTPVEILGLEGMPDAGDTFLVMADRDKAKDIAQYRKMKEREAQLAKSSRVSLEGLAEQIKQAGMKDLNLILKGDVQGSVEVLADSLEKMSTEKVRVRVLHAGVGAITESRRSAGVGFERHRHRLQRPARPQGRRACRARERRDPPALDHLRAAGRDHQGDVRACSNQSSRRTTLAAPKCSTSSRSPRSARLPVAASPTASSSAMRRSASLRDGDEVWKGKIASLKRFKDDVSEVRQGVECGIDLAGFKDIQVGDIIESFTTETLAAELGQNSAAAEKQRRPRRNAKQQQRLPQQPTPKTQ